MGFSFVTGPALHRHCEEAKPTKQSMRPLVVALDCFATLAMTV
jgi:hypothetical protein